MPDEVRQDQVSEARVVLDNPVTADHPDAVHVPPEADGTTDDPFAVHAEPTPNEALAAQQDEDGSEPDEPADEHSDE